MIKSKERGFTAVVLFLTHCSLLGPNIQQYSRWSWSSERRVPGVPAVCLYIAKTWQESTSRQPAGGARPQTPELGRVGDRAAQSRARTGRAPCPFKEADRTTRTFLTGGIRANSDNFQ